MDKDLLKKAQILHQKGKLQDALSIYLNLLHAEPNNPELLHIIGIIYAQDNKSQQALEHINQAIKLQPDNAIFHNSKGNLLQRDNNIKEALQYYQRAIQLNPKYALAHGNFANCLYRQGKFDLSEQAYRTAISLNSQYVDAHYNYAILLTRSGRFQDALQQLNKALSLYPDHASAYGLLGEIYLDREDYEKAIINYQNRLQLQPKHAESWNSAGLALLHYGKIDEAIISFRKALSLQPDLDECNYYLGTAYIKLNDQEKALACFLRQNEIKPMIECYFNIGVILMNKNRHKEAIQYLEQAETIDPAYLPIYLNLGALYLKLQNIPKAIENYEHANKLKPADKEIQHILTALQQKNTPDAAPKEYLQHLFDQYSAYYDQHLSKHLQYSVPEKLFFAVEEIAPKNSQWTILDLGCGTGLCGEKFHSLAKKLIGIDISQKMIEIAREKQIYDELIADDITRTIKKFKEVDLIIAGDVFTYIGDLNYVFTEIHHALKQEGLFAFSVEKTYAEPFILQQNIRFAHSKKYLEKIIAQHQFKILRFDNLQLRKQAGKPVEGYLVVLQK